MLRLAPFAHVSFSFSLLQICFCLLCMSPLRIVFFGTAELACASLSALVESPGFSVAAVVTQPDRPKGRNLHPQPSPVKVLAAGTPLPVLQPERARQENFVQTLGELQPDLIVVAAYGQILPRALLAELGLSKILLGSSGGGQFLLVLPDESRGPAVEFLEQAAQGIWELSGGIVRLMTPMLEGESADAAQARMMKLGSQFLPLLDSYIPL